MSKTGITPSWKQGFARSAAESAYPGGWKRLQGLWAPSLGPTGMTLFDVSGRKNNGALTNGPTWVLGDPQAGGYAVQLDGTDDVNMGNTRAGAFGTDESFSFAAWMWHDSTGTANGRAVSKQSVNPRWDFRISNAGTGQFLAFFDDGATQYQLSFTDATLVNSWHHFVVVFDRSSTLRVYVDSVSRGTPVDVTGAGDFSTNSADLKIGRRHDNTVPWKGRISDLAAWHRAVVSDEIQSLVANPNALLELATRPYATAVAGGSHPNSPLHLRSPLTGTVA